MTTFALAIIAWVALALVVGPLLGSAMRRGMGE